MAKFAVAAHLKVNADPRVPDILVNLGKVAATEPGTLHWTLFQTDEHTYTVTELFEDEAAYQLHEDNEETQRLSAQLAPFLVEVDVRNGPVVATNY